MRVIAYAVLLGAALVSLPALAHDDGAAIEDAVSRAIAPLREQIAEERSRVHLRDAVGGIGYIVGLMGAIAYVKARRGQGGA